VESGVLCQRAGAAYTNPLAELLQAVGDAHNSAEFVEHRRSQRVSALHKESMAIQEALRTPKVFRARRKTEAPGEHSSPRKDLFSTKYGMHESNESKEYPYDYFDVQRAAESGNQSAMAGSAFPSTAPSYIPPVSSLLHSLSATSPLITSSFISALPTTVGFSSTSHLQTLLPAQMAQATPASSVSPSAPSLQNLVLLSDLYPAASPRAYHPPSPLAYQTLLTSRQPSATLTHSNSSPAHSAPSFSAFTAVLSPHKSHSIEHASSNSAIRSPTAAPNSSTPNRSDLKLRVSPATPPSLVPLRPSSPSSSLSEDCLMDSLQYLSSAPTSPQSDDDSMSTVRGGDASTESSAGISCPPLASIEQCNSPALLPGCGLYAEYIHDLKGVCSQCSASGRLKSKKKPLVDSLLLLAFFGDGIKKTSNGFGYIIEDSNLARELMNIVSSHIRPPSRGTNNSYDNWKRAMGKTFRKSGTFFTPKDEDTARYARHVEEHLTRIHERKKGTSPAAASSTTGSLPSLLPTTLPSSSSSSSSSSQQTPSLM